MNRGKRFLSLILLITILIPLFNFSPSISYAAIDTDKYQGYVRGGGGYPTFTEFESQYGLNYKETLTREKDTNTYYLNIEIYVDKQLIVYTTINNNFRLYNTKNTNVNPDFKKVTNGYFSEGGNSGEYRYLGYSPDGIIMSNKVFPNDFSTNSPANESNWIQLPWKGGVLPDKVKKSLNVDPSYEDIYNDIVNISNNAKNTLRDNLGAFTNDTSESVSFALGSKMSNAESYGMILNKPSLTMAGSFRMFRNANGSYRYNTFNGVLTKKEFPELTSFITTDKTTYTMESDKDTVDVLVTVNGHLKDELYYNDNIYEMVYYSRKDVSSYDFNLTNTTNKYPRADTTSEKINKPYKEFKLSFNRSDLNEGINTLTFNSNTTVSFLGVNNEKFNSLANKIIQINVVPKTNGAYINTEIIVDPSSIEFKDSNVSVKVTIKAELKNYTATNNISKWEIKAKKDEDVSFTTVTKTSSKLVEEAEFTFTIPKSTMNNITKFEQFFTGNATVVMKSGSNLVSKDSRGSTTIWKNPPIPTRPPEGPIVSISGTKYVQAGTPVTFYGRATPQEVGVTIDSYSWYSDPISNVNGKTTKDITIEFPNLGSYNIYLDAVDSNGLMGTGLHQINVMPPYPFPIIDLGGTLKENRKVTVNGARSIGNGIYPINWSKSYWLIEPVDSSKLEDILFSASSSNLSYKDGSIKVSGLYVFDMQVPKKGEYNITLYLENTYGTSSTTSSILDIEEDIPPDVNFSTVNTILRDPNNYRKATIRIKDLTKSIDDTILKRTINIHYNSNNGKIEGYKDNPKDVSHNANWTLVKTINTTSVNEVDFTHEVHDVGKYKVEIEATEKIGQPTLATGTYRKLLNGSIVSQYYVAGSSAKVGNSDNKDINEKVIDAINIAPSTDLLVSKTGKMKKIDIVIRSSSAAIRMNAKNHLINAYNSKEVDHNIILKTNNIFTDIPWRDDSLRYYVDYSNNYSDIDQNTYNDRITQIRDSNIIYIGVNDSSRKDLILNMIADNNYRGKFIDNSSFNTAIVDITSYTLNRKPIDLFINVGNTKHDNINTINKKIDDIVRPMLEGYDIEPCISITDGVGIPENRLYYKGTDSRLYEYDSFTDQTKQITTYVIDNLYVADDGNVYYTWAGSQFVHLYKYNIKTGETTNPISGNPAFYGDLPWGRDPMGGVVNFPTYGLKKFVVNNNKLYGNIIFRHSIYDSFVKKGIIEFDLSKSVINIPNLNIISERLFNLYGFEYIDIKAGADGNIYHAFYDQEPAGGNSRLYSFNPTSNELIATSSFGMDGTGGYHVSPTTGITYAWYNIKGTSPHRFLYTKPTTPEGLSVALINSVSNTSASSKIVGTKDKVFMSGIANPTYLGESGLWMYDEINRYTKKILNVTVEILTMTPDELVWYKYANEIYTYDYKRDIHKRINISNLSIVADYHPNAPKNRILRKLGIEETIDSHNWRKESYPFYAHLNDSAINIGMTELSNTTIRSRIQEKLRDNDIAFLGLGTTSTKTNIERLTKELNFSSYINNVNIDNAFTELGLHILEYAGKQRQEVDLYVLLGEEVELFTDYMDKEIDAKFDERLIINHDSTYFESDLGQYENSGVPIVLPDDNKLSFNKTGRYEIVYQARDNPKSDSNFDSYKLWSSDSLTTVNIYAHRKPTASFSYDLSYTGGGDKLNITLTNKSFDLDHISKSNKGIVEEEWSYKNIYDEDWIKNKPTLLDTGQTYLVQLNVRDEEKAWSDPFIMEITTTKSLMKPIVKATPDISQVWYNKTEYTSRGDLKISVEAKAFDGKSIVNVMYAFSESTTEPTNYITRTSSNFNLTQSNNGVWFLHLKTIDNAGIWSENYMAGPYLMDKIDPTLSVTPTTKKSTEDMIVSISADDTGGSLFKETKYTLTTTTTKPSSGWIISKTKKFDYTIKDLGVKYLHVEAFDNAGNSRYERFGPYTIEDDLKLTATLLPNPALAGDQILFFITTEGYADKVEIVIPSDLIAMDKRVSMGYPAVTYPSIFFNLNKNIMKKEDILKYIAWVSTEDTLDKNNNRLRPPYKFIVRAYKGTVTREIELELDIRGSILELLKPGIKNKYGR